MLHDEALAIASNALGDDLFDFHRRKTVTSLTVLTAGVMGNTSTPRGIAWDATATGSLLVTGDQVVRRIKL